MRRILFFVIAGMLLCNICISALAEEQEKKTFEKAGVHVACPAELKNLHGCLEWIESVVSYSPVTYSVLCGYVAMSEEEYSDFNNKHKNGELSQKEFSDFNESKSKILGMLITTKGELEDAYPVPEGAEVIELGSADGFSHYYVNVFNPEASSNLEKVYAEEAKMLSSRLVEVFEQAEFFKPINPAAEIMGKKISFKAEDLDHNWYTSDELFSQNRFTLVNVWGSWCGPCLSEMEELGELHRLIKDKDCGLVGLEKEFGKYEKYAQKAKDLLKEKNVTYPNVLVNDEMDFMEMITEQPSSFIVNSEGVVVSPMYTGAPATGSHVLIDRYTSMLEKLMGAASYD